MRVFYSQLVKKRSAYHNWARSEAKIPGDGWIESGIMCRDVAHIKEGMLFTMKFSCRAVFKLTRKWGY
jgi:hypothetical protein